MAQFREEYLTIQDDYLRVDPSRESETEELEYSNDELGENTEVTPLDDAVENDPNDSYTIAPGDDLEDEDEDLDLEDEDEVEEDEDIENVASQVDPLDDEDEVDEDLLDDDLDTTITPDLDEEDDLLDDEGDDLSIDEDDEDFDDEK
ncbi:MAG: hypothetical protein H7Y07_13850 [Pyrinomonadaceae bacterium]|nr:hypothetical protein [Sphingobacteriaceae bacterium]